MINKTILVGRLTKDIDLRKTPTGASVVSFTLAVNRAIKQKGQPDADFINCVAWNKTAELMAEYLHKGSLIGVEGHIQVRNYDDKDGKKVYVTEIMVDRVVFLESKGQSEQNVVKPEESHTEEHTFEYAEVDIQSDDLPF